MAVRVNWNAKVDPNKGMLSATEAKMIIASIATHVAVNEQDCEGILERIGEVINRWRAYQAWTDPSVDPWADGETGVTR